MNQQKNIITCKASSSLKLAPIVLLALTLFIASSSSSDNLFAQARRPTPSSRAGGGGGAGRGGGRGAPKRKSTQVASASRRGRSSATSTSKRRNDYDYGDYDDEEAEEKEMNFGFLDDDVDEPAEAGEEEEEIRPTPRRGKRRGGGGSSRPSSRKYDDDEDDFHEEDDRGYDVDEEEDEFDDYEQDRRSKKSNRRGESSGASRRRSSGAGSGSSRGARGGRNSGNVVPYGNARSGRRQPPPRRQPQPSAFTRGLTALRESIPDPTTIKDSAFNSMQAARKTTSKLTSNIYREVKGLTSSELEQVMLKATAPNDVPVKGKHVERLVGVTYQISGRYDIYDAVLRKLWSKMAENDWRTTVKALYILHRFSADGAPDHQAALKARLRELRRTKDPKRGKEKYFNTKQLLSGDASPETKPFRAFLSRYAHYVLLRAQCFGGVFTEIANDPNNAKQSKSSNSSSSRASSSRASSSRASSSARKCITATCLKNEHLEAAQMLLKAGLACEFKSNGEEECENTAIALERVVADLIGLTSAVATALNNALKGDYDNDSDMDWDLVKKWCDFYSTELLVKTKGAMKRTTPTLDAYGLFLPSRIGASVSQDLLQKGLKGRSAAAVSEDDNAGKNDVGEEEDTVTNDEEEEVKGEENDEDVDDVEEGDAEDKNDMQEDYAVDEDVIEEEEDLYDEEYEYEEYEY